MRFLPGPEAMLVLGLLVILPAILARYLVGAGWLQLPLAFLLWFLTLWLLLGGTANSRDEGLGWTLIMGMFFSWAGVPIAALILRVTNVPYRFL